MKTIAVDGSALYGANDGISRYLRSMLRRCFQLGGMYSWTILGRDANAQDGIPLPVTAPSIVMLGDGLPARSGRVLSLLSTQPSRLRSLLPDLFWSPAHRMPLWIPQATARVVTIHDLCWAKAPETMRASTRIFDRLLMPRSLCMADRIIAVSNATREALLESDPSLSERMAVIHEAAEVLPTPEEFASLVPRGVMKPYILFVGTLEPRKNLARLIEAVGQLDKPKRDCLQLVIAGCRGWGQVEVPALAATFGIADRVRVLGSVDDQLLATLYRHARCLAMPSLYEGFGLPVLEALSQGTPALIASGSSLPEVAGDAGLVVDPLSVDSIRAGLEAMLTDDVLHARLAAAAIPQASKFSWERAARETLAVFEEAIVVRREKIRLGLV